MTAGFGVRGAYHDYSGVVVLRNVDFEVRPGEVHALVGENGSGKSTLIKLLTGALQPRRGELYLGESRLRLHSPVEAPRHGIGVVHQSYNLFPELTVAQNVMGIAGALPRRRWIRAIDHRAVRDRLGSLFEQLRMNLEPGELVGRLGPAERKFVEIARAMNQEPRFLILDEPTASLEPRSASSVLALLDRLRARGIGLVFVTHRLDEVLSIADRVTVLRDGVVVSSVPREGLSEQGLAELIVGHEHRESAPRELAEAGPPVVRMRDVRIAPGAPPVDLELKRGEVFGLTGLLGSGAAEVVKMLGGAKPMAGEIEVEGRRVRLHAARDASRAGIGYVPEDRKSVGLVLDQSVAANISLASLGRVSRRGVISHARIAERAERYRRDLDIRTRSIEAPVRTLSGGNQQKVMIAKWLASGVRIMAVEEPTQGVDVGGKAQIHELLRTFASQGGTILLASTDVHEVLALCDRIGIFRHGALTGVLSRDELTKSELTARGASDPEDVLARLVESDEEAREIA